LRSDEHDRHAVPLSLHVAQATYIAPSKKSAVSPIWVFREGALIGQRLDALLIFTVSYKTVTSAIQQG
jgi:hypothetical protein